MINTTQRRPLPPPHTVSIQPIHTLGNGVTNVVMEQSDSESGIGTGHFMWRANISGSLFPVSIQTKLHALHKTLPAVGVLWKCLHVEAAELMWFYKRDCLAPRASLGVASSDICWPPFCPLHTHQLCPTLQLTFCNILPLARRTKLFCKLSMDDETGVSLKCPLSHISKQLWSGYLTHVHKSTCVKRKTGLIVA